MAEIEGPIRFKGSIGDVTCYYNSVLKKWIFRKKGGAHKNHIKKSKKFKNVRLNMSEFKACGEWCHLVRMGLFKLDDFNWGLYMSGIVQLSKTIQLMDGEGLWGNRNIESSKHKEMLTDIVFNAQYPFNKVVMRRPEVIADEMRMSITVNLTQFYSLRELVFRKGFSSYRFAMTIAQLSDYVYDPVNKEYAPKHAGLENRSVVVFSEWYRKSANPEDISLSAAFPAELVPPADATVMVGLGVEFATNLSGNSYYSAKGDRTMKLVDCL